MALYSRRSATREIDTSSFESVGSAILSGELDGLRLFENLGDKENAPERVVDDALPHGRTGLRFAVKR